jgi:hypothetical protein
VQFLVRYVDAIIPFVCGIAMLFMARKAQAGHGVAFDKPALEKRQRKLGLAGKALIVVGIGYFFLQWSQQSPAEWQEDWSQFSPDGRYSLMLPVDRRDSTYSEQTPDGPAHSYKWNAGKNPAVVSYIFRYTDFPPGASPNDPASAMKLLAERISAQPGFRLLDSETMACDGYPRLVMHISVNDKFQQTSHIIITNHRQYVLIHTCQATMKNSEGPFFSSFRVLRDD